jgi:iron(III) transport system ATP-binding protein
MIRQEMLAVLKSHGATALVVTHDPEEAMYVADRIAVMNRGRVEQVGTPFDVYCHPVNSFVTRFFSSTNRFTTTIENGAARTPFGPLPSPAGLENGCRVDVLIRPEALRIDGQGNPGSLQARVETARMLRRAVFLQLCIGNFEGQDLHFHARDPGHRMPKAGENVTVTLDPQQTFIFRSAES